MFSSLTSGEVLQTLLVALLVGLAFQQMGAAGKPVLRGAAHLQRVVFRVLSMIMWAAPVGAFGAMAAVVGETGVDALKSLGRVDGRVLHHLCGVRLRHPRHGPQAGHRRQPASSCSSYLAREFLLILSTSSSESALPRLIAKMEHAGVDKSTVGVVVPTGYSFNLDGTAIYLTMASLFIAEALGDPLSIGEQISLLVFMVIASKGAAGVTGCRHGHPGRRSHSHRPELVDGVGLIVGIDRFMSEARALTNFAGNSVATVLIGHWTDSVDRAQLNRVLDGDDPFDETTMLDAEGELEPDLEPAKEPVPA